MPEKVRLLGMLDRRRGNLACGSCMISPDCSTIRTLPLSWDPAITLLSSFRFLVATRDIILACIEVDNDADSDTRGEKNETKSELRPEK